MGKGGKEREYIWKHLASIFHTGVFCLKGDECISYEENLVYNPLYNSETLRNALRDSVGGDRGRRHAGCGLLAQRFLYQ